VTKFDKKDFVLCLLAGVAIAAILIGLAILNPPWMHLLSEKWRSFLLLTGLFLAFMISQYRRAWNSKGYWALLVIWLSAHTLAWSLILRSVDRFPPFAVSALLAGCEGAAFAASVYWVLGIPPLLK
jgi:hypothetical protein